MVGRPAFRLGGSLLLLTEDRRRRLIWSGSAAGATSRCVADIDAAHDALRARGVREVLRW